jgi:hypothetical protein
LLTAIPSRESDVESATGNLLEGSHDVPALNVLDVGVRVQNIRGCNDDPKMIDNILPVVQMPESLDNDSPTNLVSVSSWNRRVLESLTMYRELSTARIPEEFAPVRLRFEREWTFNGGFVSRFTVTFCF